MKFGIADAVVLLFVPRRVANRTVSDVSAMEINGDVLLYSGYIKRGLSSHLFLNIDFVMLQDLEKKLGKQKMKKKKSRHTSSHARASTHFPLRAS